MRGGPRVRFDAEAVLGPSGPLSREPFYEHRPAQIALSEKIWATFDDGGILLAEAGTGTGKSLAYLLPSALLPHRVVLSTGTKALQEQLVRKDIPLLEKILGHSLKTVAMKGRANYLCRHFWERFEKEPLLDAPDHAAFLDAVRRWVRETETGDRAEIRDVPEDVPFWKDVNARGERCLGRRCPRYEDCFIVRLRREAEGADLVVVNHHLLCADLALRGKWDVTALPDYAFAVLDEAHDLHDAAVSFFGVRVSKRMLQELVRDLERAAAPLRDAPWLEGSRGLMEKGLFYFGSYEGEDGKEALEDRHRTESRMELQARLERALESVSVSLEGGTEVPETYGLLERLQSFRESLAFILDGEDENYVRWAEVRGPLVSLGANPIEVSSILEEHLFSRLRGGVLTSGTLTVGGRFDYFRASLGLPESCGEHLAPSAFDFERAGLLYVPRRFPLPNQAGFTSNVLSTVDRLIRASGGRAFVLCTSYRQMDRVAEHLKEAGEFPLLVQGEQSKGILLDRFRESGRAVLVGTASFWQGVDVQGDALSLVVLDKIPFAFPGDPLEKARIRMLESRGTDPFRHHQLPAAAILLRQGVGRLIRSRTDRGVVACLDARLRTRPYGRLLLSSLPPLRLTDSLEEAEAFLAEGPQADDPH